jgi:signal peptidase II
LGTGAEGGWLSCVWEGGNPAFLSKSIEFRYGSRMRPLFAGLSAALFALFADQAHKLSMIYGLGWQEGERVALLPMLDHVLVWNKGISYGLFQQETPLGQWLLFAFKIVVIAGLLVWLLRVTEKRLAIALGLIIGGALGNTVDRLLYGAVADFFHFHVGNFSWYVFNIADCAIVGGVAILVYDSLFPRRPAIEKP